MKLFSTVKSLFALAATSSPNISNDTNMSGKVKIQVQF